MHATPVPKMSLPPVTCTSVIQGGITLLDIMAFPSEMLSGSTIIKGWYSKCCSLARHLYECDRDRYCKHLSASLGQYGVSLREAEGIDNACEAAEKVALALARYLYQRDRERRCVDLSSALQRYGVPLREAGQSRRVKLALKHCGTSSCDLIMHAGLDHHGCPATL